MFKCVQSTWKAYLHLMAIHQLQPHPHPQLHYQLSPERDRLTPPWGSADNQQCHLWAWAFGGTLPSERIKKKYPKNITSKQKTLNASAGSEFIMDKEGKNNSSYMRGKGNSCEVTPLAQRQSPSLPLAQGRALRSHWPSILTQRYMPFSA